MDLMKLSNEALLLAERHNDLELFELISQIKNELSSLHMKPDLEIEEQWGHFTSNND